MKVKFIMTLFVVLLVSFLPTYVNAEEGNNSFTVQPEIKSPLQVKDVTSYYHFKSENKDLNESLRFKITNKSNEEIKVKASVFDSYTSPNGVIDYISKEQGNELKSSVIDDKYRLTNYLSLDKDISIKPSQTTYLDIPVSVKKLEGSILGGIAFTEVKEDATKGLNSDSNFKLITKTNTIFAVQIDFSDIEAHGIEYSKPNIVSLPSMFVIELPTKLTQPKLLLGGKIVYEVRDSKGQVLFMSSDNQKVDLTSKSGTNLILPWNYPKVDSKETYRLSGYILTKEMDEYPFDTKLEYSSSGLLTSASDDKEKPELIDGLTLKDYIIAGISLLLFVLLLILSLRKKKYVLYSDRSVAKHYISSSDEDFAKIVRKADAVNINNLRYEHTYVRKKRGSVHYIHSKSLDLKTINTKSFDKELVGK